MAKEQMTEDIIMEKKDIGEVKIASDVVSVIAALAATEVEGVNSMAGMNKFGVKNTKGVRVLMNEGRRNWPTSPPSTTTSGFRSTGAKFAGDMPCSGTWGVI